MKKSEIVFPFWAQKTGLKTKDMYYLFIEDKSWSERYASGIVEIQIFKDKNKKPIIKVGHHLERLFKIISLTHSKWVLIRDNKLFDSLSVENRRIIISLVFI